MNEEEMKEIERLNGGVLKQADLAKLGFNRNSYDVRDGVYDLYWKRISDRIELEVSFITGEGSLTFSIGTATKCKHETFPLTFASSEQLKHFIASFIN